MSASVPMPAPSPAPSPIVSLVQSIPSMPVNQLVSTIITLAHNGFRVFISKKLYNDIADKLSALGITARRISDLTTANKYIVLSYAKSGKITVAVFVRYNGHMVRKYVPLPAFIKALEELVEAEKEKEKITPEEYVELVGKKKVEEAVKSAEKSGKTEKSSGEETSKKEEKGEEEGKESSGEEGKKSKRRRRRKK